MKIEEFSRKLLTKREVATICGVCQRTVDYWINKKAIAYIKIGGTVRFLRSDLDAFIQTNRIGRPV
jgi:excisionase family DNA binding protein